MRSAGGGANLADIGDALAGFDNRHQIDAANGQAALALEAGHHPIDHLQIGRALDLGQDDAVDTLGDNRFDIAEGVFGVESINADVAATRARRLQGFDNGGAGRHFFRNRDGVLEIEDHGIGTGVKHLGDFARMVAGCKQECAVRLHVSRAFLS